MVFLSFDYRHQHYRRFSFSSLITPTFKQFSRFSCISELFLETFLKIQLTNKQRTLSSWCLDLCVHSIIKTAFTRFFSVLVLTNRATINKYRDWFIKFLRPLNPEMGWNFSLRSQTPQCTKVNVLLSFASLRSTEMLLAPKKIMSWRNIHIYYLMSK